MVAGVFLPRGIILAFIFAHRAQHSHFSAFYARRISSKQLATSCVVGPFPSVFFSDCILPGLLIVRLVDFLIILVVLQKYASCRPVWLTKTNWCCILCIKYQNNKIITGQYGGAAVRTVVKVSSSVSFAK